VELRNTAYWKLNHFEVAVHVNQSVLDIKEADNACNRRILSLLALEMTV
jgi:hypothetical protein